MSHVLFAGWLTVVEPTARIVSIAQRPIEIAIVPPPEPPPVQRAQSSEQKPAATRAPPDPVTASHETPSRPEPLPEMMINEPENRGRDPVSTQSPMPSKNIRQNATDQASAPPLHRKTPPGDVKKHFALFSAQGCLRGRDDYA